MFRYTVYTFSSKPADTCPILGRMLARLLAAALIYLLSIPFDLGSENCASWFRISVSREGREREDDQYACANTFTSRACVCAHLRHVGSLFVPRAETTSCLRSLVSFAALRPSSPVTSPLAVLPLFLPPLPRLHASIASMRVSIDALRACIGSK